MKTLSLLPFLLALILFSCQKDPQEKLCDGVVCFHGGVCVNGECECPPQYTGPSCAQEVAPVKMRVTYITLTSYPPTDPNGAGWDLFDGPDVFITISKSGSTLFTSPYFEDFTGNGFWDASFEFSDPKATYKISVWDYDDGLTADDLMGAINFTPYQPSQDFPTSYSVECTGCDVSFNFSGVSYFH